MQISEEWGIAAERLRAFFDSQSDVHAVAGGYVFRGCRITLSILPHRMLGPCPMPRTKVTMVGPDGDVETIHRRFFLQFLSAGG